MIRLDLKIPEDFIGLFYLGQFWFVPITLVSKAKIESFAQFPVDHLSNPIMSSLVFLLYRFAAFAYYMINLLISITT